MPRRVVPALCAVIALFAHYPELSAQAPAKPPTPTAQLDSVRKALAKYQDPMAAVRDGYLSTVACLTYPTSGKAGETPYPAGGMGVHFMNASLIGTALHPMAPTALVYEPHGDTLRLVGAEWFVPTQTTQDRPSLFGRPFDGPMPGHLPIMPANLEHWDLHVWLWRENPAGVFAPTNPAVKCPASVRTAEMRD